MVKNIILSNPTEERTARDDGSQIIRVAEMFSNTIQGENFSGFPATFLRLQRCTLQCQFCDTVDVWKNGNPYSVWELVEIMESHGVVDDLQNGHHLILTGGSPLLQQDALIEMIDIFQEKYRFKPFIEIENECTLMPKREMIEYVNLWNNSPKLSNSGMNEKVRLKPDVLAVLGSMENSFFKFVVSKPEDWDEIERDFILPGILVKEKIVLMPEGMSRDELQEKYEWLVDLCCQHSVRFCDRLHVTIWNLSTGV